MKNWIYYRIEDGRLVQRKIYSRENLLSLKTTYIQPDPSIPNDIRRGNFADKNDNNHDKNNEQKLTPKEFLKNSKIFYQNPNTEFKL